MHRLLSATTGRRTGRAALHKATAQRGGGPNDGDGASGRGGATGASGPTVLVAVRDVDRSTNGSCGHRGRGSRGSWVRSTWSFSGTFASFVGHSGRRVALPAHRRSLSQRNSTAASGEASSARHARRVQNDNLTLTGLRSQVQCGARSSGHTLGAAGPVHIHTAACNAALTGTSHCTPLRCRCTNIGRAGAGGAARIAIVTSDGNRISGGAGGAAAGVTVCHGQCAARRRCETTQRPVARQAVQGTVDMVKTVISR